MTQSVLPFKYESDKSKTQITSLGGLPLYLELIHVINLRKMIQKHIGVRKNKFDGYSDTHIITTLILLNLAGGESVEDLKILASDKGFCKLLKKAIIYGLKGKTKKQYLKFLKSNGDRIIPSPSTIFRYLAKFHNIESEKNRVKGKAFIPEKNKYLKGSTKVMKEFLSFITSRNQDSLATLDMDATLVGTNKRFALFSYKGFKSYQPINSWWAEQELIVHSEFRDGNVPAGFEQLRVFQESLSVLPSHIKKVRLRSDTAGYQHNLLRFCDQKRDDRFGKIEFAIGCNVTPEFKKAIAELKETDWHSLYKTEQGYRIKTNTEWAEVCFVPNAIGNSKKGSEYRYLVKRTPINKQENLPGIEIEEQLPFPSMDIKETHYKVFGVVTNMDWEGGTLINWHHERCGKSEEAHSIMKEDLAGGRLPSGDFGENAIWWWIMILSMNINTVMKRFALGEKWITKRMKAIRYYLINIPARILSRSHSIYVRIKETHPMYEKIFQIRAKIMALEPSTG